MHAVTHVIRRSKAGQMDLATFIRTYLDMPSVGDTEANRGQCVGLIEKWLDMQGAPHIWGNAADLLMNADLRIYRIVRNLPTNAPAAGNIVCWDASWGGGFGHTGVVVAANARKLVTFEQNNPAGAPPLVATHDYAGVAGWILLPLASA